MKPLLRNSIIVALAAAGLTGARGDTPKAAPAKLPAPVSVFVMPAGTRDGRDPFFPESTRPYEDTAPTKAHPVETSYLVIAGHSVEHGLEMVIINNHTFAVGDEGDVLTPTGRVHLRLLAIRGDTAQIEINGTTREIKISDK